MLWCRLSAGTSRLRYTAADLDGQIVGSIRVVGLLSRLFGYAMADALQGARLNDPDAWVVPATRDGAAMLRALHILLPGGGFV
jgi:hypothetical protein